MKGYIYITGKGADPRFGTFNDPIFGRTPTLGACMPNIRRAVVRGDYIFVVSGRVPQAQQFVVGGFRVEEKIHALAAYKRFPENRLHHDEHGRLIGNVIVDSRGRQHALDHHNPDSLERRLENYIVGSDSLVLSTEAEQERGRAETLERLSTILQKPQANRVFDIMGRWAKMTDEQVAEMIAWLQGIKAHPA